MNIIWSNEIDSALKVGFPLMEFGINNWALDARSALLAISKLGEMGIGILGGDVYVNNNGTIEANYDNWYCNIMQDETPLAFIQRSNSVAVAYIENYLIQTPGVNPLFAIVPLVAK